MKHRSEGVAEAMERAVKRRRLLKDRFLDENLHLEAWKKQEQIKLKRKREDDEVEAFRGLFGRFETQIDEYDGGVVDDLAQKRRKLYAFEEHVDEEDLVSMKDVEMGGVDYSQTSTFSLSKLPTPKTTKLHISAAPQ